MKKNWIFSNYDKSMLADLDYAYVIIICTHPLLKQGDIWPVMERRAFVYVTQFA